MRARPLASLLVIIALLAAGCLQVPDAEDVTPATGEDGLSKARFDALPGRSEWITASSDGTRLHTRLFLPDTTPDPEWASPTILVMSPYFGPPSREDELNASSPPAYFRYQWLIENFVPRGYAVAFADVRGTGESGGCLEQTAELQRQDGYDTVEWLAAQDWSNGRVGMFGKSYDAETQQGTALLAPPGLTTIVPVASVSGQYEWNFYDGVPFTLHTLMGNAFYMIGDGLEPPTTAEGAAQYPTRAGCHPGMLAQAAHRDGDWDDYWASREFRPHVDNIEASVLYVHGLQDWNVRPVAVRDWFDRIPSEKRAILGQWAHDYPEENRWEEDWSRQDWRETVHKWYDHWLLGIENGIMDALPPVQVQDSEGAWRAEATYPPTDAVDFTLHLTADGALAPNATSAWDAPLGLRENWEAFARERGVPVEDAPSGEYATALTFTSAAFPERVHFSGWPVLTFDLALIDGLYPDPDAVTDAHFAANLFLVAPDGSEEWLNSGYLSARHRGGVDAPEPVPEDDVLTYALRFHPADTVIPEGHALKLVLAGSDAETEPEGTGWGALLHAGALTLPAIERDLTEVGLDVPLGEPITE